MHGIKRAALLILLLTAALVILVFVLENQQSLAFSFLGWVTPQVPASVFVVVALIVGLSVGPLMALLFRRDGAVSRRQ